MSRISKRKEQKSQSNIGNWLKKIKKGEYNLDIVEHGKKIERGVAGL